MPGVPGDGDDTCGCGRSRRYGDCCRYWPV